MIIKLERFHFKKLRVLLAWIGGIFLVTTSHTTDASYRWGIPLLLLGESIRIWASGHLERKGKKLATSGPFAYVRNPLYIGNFLLGLGIVIFSNNWISALLFLAGFVFVYRGTVLREEVDLQNEFGTAYTNYKQAVPRFLPRTRPYAACEQKTFSWAPVFKHREYMTIAGILILIGGFYISEEIAEGKKISEFWKIETALGLIGLAVIILAFEWVRKQIQKKETRAVCLAF